MSKKSKNIIKKYLPRPETIPAIVILGGVGAAVMWKAVPRLMQAVTEATPTIKLPKKGGGES
jgi:hypothetical protein